MVSSHNFVDREDSETSVSKGFKQSANEVSSNDYN